MRTGHKYDIMKLSAPFLKIYQTASK